MSWREAVETARMDRVAVVVPTDVVDEALAVVGRIAVLEPDLGALEALGQVPPHAEEASVKTVGSAALRHGRVAALAGWAPESRVDELATELRPLGSTVVRLRLPAGAEPPTLVTERGPSAAMQPLVDTYTTVPYADLNPSVLAGIAYMAMFGMMFADAGHGLLVILAGLGVSSRRVNPSGRFKKFAPFMIGAGVASVGFGIAFGEAFGPTGILPTLWLSPLDQPTTLLAVAIAVGAGLLAASYVLATVNRLREGGLLRALFSAAGLAGALLYAGIGIIGLGWYAHSASLEIAGAALAGVSLAFCLVDLYAQAGGRASGIPQVAVELFDTVVRLGTNTISFARLAAFGMTHAALSQIVWRGTTVLWHRSSIGAVAACTLFVVGTAVTFALEALIAAVQALRLEYYELFSRIFVSQGRPFRPWHTNSSEEVSCLPG